VTCEARISSPPYGRRRIDQRRLRFVLPLERPSLLPTSDLRGRRESLMVVDPQAEGLEDAIRRLLMDGELQESLGDEGSDTRGASVGKRVVADHREAYVAARAPAAATSPLTGHEPSLTGTRPGGRQPAGGNLTLLTPPAGPLDT